MLRHSSGTVTIVYSNIALFISALEFVLQTTKSGAGNEWVESWEWDFRSEFIAGFCSFSTSGCITSLKANQRQRECYTMILIQKMALSSCLTWSGTSKIMRASTFWQSPIREEYCLCGSLRQSIWHCWRMYCTVGRYVSGGCGWAGCLESWQHVSLGKLVL